MTKKQFRHDMRRGLGTCILELQRTGDLAKYEEDVLWGCGHLLAFDTQCEGTRAWLLNQLIRMYEDRNLFRDTLARTAEKKIRDMDWLFEQAAETLCFMAEEGDAEAKEIMLSLYERVVSELSRRRGRKNGTFPEEDTFESLCNMMLLNLYEDVEQQLAFYQRVQRDLENIRQRNPWIRDRLDLDWFEDNAQELLGEYYPSGCQADGDTEQGNAETAVEKQNKDCKKIKMSVKHLTAKEVYQIICAGGKFGKDFRGGQINHWKKQGREDEMGLLERLYVKEQDTIVKTELLKVLRFSCMSRMGHRVTDGGVIACMINDAQSEDTELAEAAWQALNRVKKSQVARKFALRTLQAEPMHADALSVLVLNGKAEDRKLAESLIKTFKGERHREELHHISFRVTDRCDEDGKKKYFTNDLLMYLFYENPCSYCRYHILELLDERGCVTEEMKEQCRYDSNEDIRAFYESE